MTLQTLLNNLGVIAGLGGALIVAYLVWYNRNKDVTDAIDSKNILSQKEYINTLEKEKIYLQGEIKVRDEQIANLKKLLDDQKADFQRQIDTLTSQVLEIKNSNDQIANISSTLQLFLPLTKDIEEFHKADKQILDILHQLMKLHKVTDKRQH